MCSHVRSIRSTLRGEGYLSPLASPVALLILYIFAIRWRMIVPGSIHSGHIPCTCSVVSVSTQVEVFSSLRAAYRARCETIYLNCIPQKPRWHEYLLTQTTLSQNSPILSLYYCSSLVSTDPTQTLTKRGSSGGSYRIVCFKLLLGMKYCSSNKEQGSGKRSTSGFQTRSSMYR